MDLINNIDIFDRREAEEVLSSCTKQPEGWEEKKEFQVQANQNYQFKINLIYLHSSVK